MPRCADQITLKLLRTRRLERGNVASLEAAKAVFRAAWDRRPTHKKTRPPIGGTPGGLALLEIRDGEFGGWVALIQLRSFERGDARLASCT